MTHTPGPWNIVTHSTGIRSSAPYHVVVAGGAGDGRRPVAECHLLAEVAANAQLIAAAPDLYEALKHFADMYDVTGDPVAYYQNATLRNQVRAAIAKAEGRGS